MTPAEPERDLSEAAKHDKSWGPRAFELAKALSDGDRSVLVAMLDKLTAGEEAPAMMTSRGSPNDWLWAHLSRVGILEVAMEDVPEPLRAFSVAYRITDEGRITLPHLAPTLVTSRA